jgi:hypothetical protein
LPRGGLERPAPEELPEVQRRHLLGVARAAGAKDLAGMLVLLVTQNDHPGEVLAELLRLLDRRPELDPAARRVVQAARLQMARHGEMADAD